MEKKKKLSLPVQIFIALVLGIVVGLVFYFTGAAGFHHQLHQALR